MRRRFDSDVSNYWPIGDKNEVSDEVTAHKRNEILLLTGKRKEEGNQEENGLEQ